MRFIHLLLLAALSLSVWAEFPKPKPEDGVIVPPGTTRPPERRANEIQARGWLIDYRDGVQEDQADALEWSLGFDARWLQGEFGREEKVAWLESGRELGAEEQKLLMESGLVEAIEPNAIFELVSNQLPQKEERSPVSLSKLPQPNPGDYQDPFYRHQWHMAQIGVSEAHRKAQGKGVVVAVIDTGVAYEKHGRYNLARDLNQARFIKPFNFIDNTIHANDDHGHGTHVAGTIAQSTNNGLGVIGVAPEATIMPLKVLDGSGRGDIRGIARAIAYAADNGAHVINLSLGGPLPVGVLRKALQHARSKGTLPVCAAGNSGGSIGWPARYPECMAVSALQFDENLTFYSSRGKEISIAAPGGNVRVDQNGDGLPDGVLQNTVYSGDPSRDDYMLFMGTSMASPHVAGVAALIYSMGVKNPQKVEKILLASARPKKGPREFYGAGILNAAQATALVGQAVGGSWNASDQWICGNSSFYLGCGSSYIGYKSHISRIASGFALVAGVAAAMYFSGLNLLAMPLFWLGLLIFGAGLNWLPGLESYSFLQALPGLDEHLAGEGGTPLWRSILPFLGLVLMTLHKKVLLPLLSGGSFGLFGWFLAQLLVILPQIGSKVLGWFPLILDIGWLGLQAFFSLYLARRILKILMPD